MSIFGRERTPGKELDPQTCFELWVELGSLEKVRQHLYDHGVRHPITDESYTGGGIRESAFRWVLGNPEKAYEAVSRQFKNMDQEAFDRWLVYKAMRAYSTERRFRKWLIENDIYDSQKFRHIYDHRYPNIHNPRTGNS